MVEISGSLRATLPPHAPNLAQSLLDRVAATPQRPAYRYPRPDGTWASMTWREAGQAATELAAGLLALGLGPQDRVAIASSTRTEWILADAAVMLAGGATTTIYPSTAEEEFGYILADSAARILVAEDAGQAAKALGQRDRIPELATIVLIDGEGGAGVGAGDLVGTAGGAAVGAGGGPGGSPGGLGGADVIGWARLRQLGVQALAELPGLVADRVAEIQPDWLATLMYTSGTTGRPKGVMLPHRCWVFQGASTASLGLMRIEDVHYMWLPLSHSFGKLLLAMQYQVGLESVVDGRVDRIAANLPVARATLMCGVPRIFEKIYAGATARADAAGGAKARVFRWAFETSAGIRSTQRAGQPVGPLAGIRLALAERLVFARIKAALGGRMRLMVSGSAALNGEVARWFDAAGLPIIEGYGLTENSAAACIVRPEDMVFGKVGQPLPGTQVGIAEDGEVLLRGPHVMAGYWNLPEADAETLLPDGWLATGDIGVLDEEGRLTITDRKKDLVKTSGGKYVAPGQIAAQFKVISPLASNLVVVAGDRNYATALVSLDPDALGRFAADKGLSGDYAALSASPQVHAAIEANIDTLNARLNRWETIKRFTILPRDLSEEDGELTASLKVKRRVVEQHFAEEIAAMYRL